jgi:uncharacterized protein YbaA (DUF1428 family)
MAQYVDGFVIPIKRNKLKAYKKLADWGCKVWMKHGALHYYETYVDDFSKHGLGFKKMCKLKPGETAVFAFVVYKSKAHRNSVNKKVMKEMEAAGNHVVMPFDMRRFSMGGCKVMVKKNR